MDFEVRGFVSSVLEDAVDCFADAEEALAIDFFADDFQDEVEVPPSRDEVSTMPARREPNMMQYLCRLLDGALSGEARVFDKPPASDALLLAGKRFARSRAATELCPRNDTEKQVLLPLDCLPLSPPVALKGPRVAMLLGGSKAFTPYVFSVPRPPSMPRVKQPRRNVRPFITKAPLILTNEDPEEAESFPRFSKASSAMALDLGLAEEFGNQG